MNVKSRFAFGVVCGLVLAAAVYIVIYEALMTKMANRGLNEQVRFYEGQLVLSTNDCKQLSTDLESANPIRLAIWRTYFDYAAQGKITSGRPDLKFRDMLSVYNDQYKSHEKPARSNYFGMLLTALAEQQQRDGITVNELIGYLGEPDETSDSPGGKVMLYRFSASGRNAVGLVEAQKDAVSVINIKVTALSGGAGK
jgi:hypothetical protein